MKPGIIIRPQAQVEIGGEFDGDICAANIRPDLPLPEKVEIASFGPDATICGWKVDCKVDADCEVVPRALYGIKAVEVSDEENEVESAELQVATVSLNSPYYFADVVGPHLPQGVWSPPDGTVNFDDVTACLWAWTTPSGMTIPPIEWVDLYGNESGLPANKYFDPPDMVANASDLQYVLFGFSGRPYPFYDPADCPDVQTRSDPGSAPPPPTGSPSFVLLSNDDLLDPEEDLQIEVHIDDATNVFGYEFALEVTGGTSGTLTLIDVSVDEERTDYLFNGVSGVIKGKDLARETYGATLSAAGAGITKSGETYLATFTYQPTGGAYGEFTISVKGELVSFLLTPDGSAQRIETDAVAVVGYGVDCLNDGHCDDNNDCTIDACTSNECGYTNVTSGTACDDGLWCTNKGSTCDGNGNCTGGNPRCDPGEICDEQGQQCISQQ